jgi:tetratricopeptide (TPR) repeat protein
MRASQSGRSLPRSNSSPSGSPDPASGRRFNRKCAILGLAVVAVLGGYFLVQYLRAQKHLAGAEQALEQRNFPEAKAQLARSLAIRSENAETSLLAIRIARRARQTKEAGELVRLHQQKYPADKLLAREARLLQTQQGNISDIDSILTESLARGNAADPLELEAALVGGTNLLQIAFAQRETSPGGRMSAFLLKVQSGASLWLQMRPATPDQVEGLVWRGLTRAYANDSPGSIADFRAALALDPTHHDARLSLAFATLQEFPAEAAGHLQLLRQHSPNDLHIAYPLAIAYRSMGRMEAAEQLLDEMLAVEPNNVPGLIERGLLALDQGQFAEAERRLSQAQAQAPDDPRANFTLAACLRTVGKVAEAKEYHARFLRLQDERLKQFEQAGPAPVAPR